MGDARGREIWTVRTNKSKAKEKLMTLMVGHHQGRVRTKTDEDGGIRRKSGSGGYLAGCQSGEVVSPELSFLRRVDGE